MSQSINTKLVEIVVGEIQLEATFKISDPCFQFVSAQSGN